jgi:hypothetical protein
MLSVKQAKWEAVSGTSLQGSLAISYSTLVEIFGSEHSEGDGYKVDAEWQLQFSNGVVATIYNYKDGVNYCGEDGLPVEDITDWHIGGKSRLAEKTVEQYIEQHVALGQARADDQAIQ